MAEVAQNEGEKKMASEEKLKQTAPNLKQLKLSFPPKKVVLPSFVRVEKPVGNVPEGKSSSCSNDVIENHKSPVTSNESKKSEKSEETKEGKKEKSAVNGTPSKKKTDELVVKSSKKGSLSEKALQSPKVSLVQLKLGKISEQLSKPSKSSDKNSVKSNKKVAKDSSSKQKQIKSDTKSKSASTKKSSNSKGKDTTKAKSLSTANATGKDAAKENTPSTPKKAKKSLDPSQRGSKSKQPLDPDAPVLVPSSDEEEGLSLAQLKKQITPVKQKNPDSADKMNNGQNVIKMAPMNPLVVDAAGNQKMIPNGPSPKPASFMPQIVDPPRLNPVQTKSIIIAIDMDPKKWKALSPQEQNRIIDHKKEIARRQLLTLNPNQTPPSRMKIPTRPPPVYNNHHIPNQNNVSIVPPPFLRGQVHLSRAPPLLSPPAMHPAPIPHHPAAHPANHHFINRYMSPRPRLPPGHTLHPSMGPLSPRMPNLQMPHMQQMQQRQPMGDFMHQKQDESFLTNLQPLPITKRIPAPPGFPSQKFGDVAMIVEFVNTFQSFLMCEEKLTADMLMKGVCYGTGKADVVANLLYLFLKVLLSREDYKVYGLKLELADLPLTEFTVSFLVSQLIKSHLKEKKDAFKRKQMEKVARYLASKREEKNDAGQMSGSDSDYDPTYDAVTIDSDSDQEWRKTKNKGECFPKGSLDAKINNISIMLEQKEFWQLYTSEQIVVLSFLVNLILDSEDLSDYYDDLSEQKSKIYREVDDYRKMKAKMKMDQTVITLDQFTKPLEKDEGSNDKKTTENLENADGNTETKSDDSKEKSDPDPYAGLTQRKIEALKAEKLKNERKQKEKERLQKEELEKRQEKNMAKLNKILDLTKRAMRVEPLGEDRYHRLYWFFPESLPGLYVSSPGPVSDTALPATSYKESWTYYDKEEDINQLLCALTVRGIREDKLKSRIRDNHVALISSMRTLDSEQQAKKEEQEKMASDIKDQDKCTDKNDTSENTDENVNESDEKNKVEVVDLDNDGENSKEETEIATKDVQEKGGLNDKVKTTEGKGDSDDKMELDKEKNEVEENEDDEATVGKSENKIDDDDKIEIDEESPEKGKEETNENKLEAKDEKCKEDTLNDSDKSSIDEDKKETNEGKLETKLEEGKDDDNESPKSSIEKGKEETNEDKSETKVEERKEDTKYDAYKASIEALKADIIESANRIVHGSLGGIPNLENWIAQVSSVDEIEKLKEFILQIQGCVLVKNFLSPFSQSKENISNEWCRWVTKAGTLSTLHMLYGVLENSIKWEMSAENMRCKVCRRKKGSDPNQQIIVCDECNLGYHSTCLRPPLDYIPPWNWKCPSCMTQEEKNKEKDERSRKKAKREEAEDDSEEEGETDHEEFCHVCETDGLMILCDTCPFSYHLECHKPPLHHTPRGDWSCYECTEGKKKKRGGRGGGNSRSRKPTRSKYVDSNSDSDESDKNSDSSSEGVKYKIKGNTKKKLAAKPAKPKETKPKRNYKKRKLAVTASSEESSAESSSQDSDDDFKGKKRKAKLVKKDTKTDRSTRTRKKRAISTTENDEEINSDNFKTKVRKFSYKGRKVKPADDKQSGKGENDTHSKGSDSDSNSDVKLSTKSVSLGNKRPRYAKDGLKNLKESPEKLSNSSMEAKSENENRTSKEDKSENVSPSSKNESPSEKEVLRNRSSTDRSFRQVGRNSRRGCNYEMQACNDILIALRKHKDAWPFLVPVNIKKAPNYLDVVETPMDFSVILKNLNEFVYDDVLKFIDDVKLVFANSSKYNSDTSDVGQAGVRLNEEFQQLLKTHLPELYATFDS